MYLKINLDNRFNVYWTKTINKLSINMYSFVDRYLNNILTDATNTM